MHETTLGPFLFPLSEPQAGAPARKLAIIVMGFAVLPRQTLDQRELLG